MFWALFRRYNRNEEAMNALEASGEKMRPIAEVRGAGVGEGRSRSGMAAERDV